MLMSRKQRAIRRAETRKAIARQVRILLFRGVATRKLDQPHRLAKHHALNCGRPSCLLCSNPRHSGAAKGRDRLTRQELRAIDRQAEGEWLVSADKAWPFYTTKNL